MFNLLLISVAERLQYMIDLCPFVRLYKTLCILCDPDRHKFIHRFVFIVLRSSSYIYRHLENVGCCPGFS